MTQDPKQTGRPQGEEWSRDQALFRAVGALSILAVAVLIIFFWQSGKEGGPDASGRSTNAGPSRVEAPVVAFTDVTEAAGLRFVHDTGACGEKLLPESLGSGVAFFDYDNDGDADLLLVNGQPWPECPNHASPPPGCVLYRNETVKGGPIRLVDATKGSGLEHSLYGMGAAVGDYDNDGWVDVYITAVGTNRLYRNRGKGVFEDVTVAAGVGGGASQWSTSACWFDYNRDGRLDLFVCHYVQWSKPIDLAVDYRLAGMGRAYGPPYNYAGTFPTLFHNDGQGRFSDVTAVSGLQLTNRATGQPMAKSLGVTPVDIDDDGWLDLVVANDTVQNFVFHNQRPAFIEVGAKAGVAFDSFGGTRGAMGIDTARSGQSGALSIAIGNFANEMTALYVSQPPVGPAPERTLIQFSDQAIQQGIGSVSQPALTFGVFFFDYDLDGWEDLLTVNGHIEPDIERLDSTQHYRQSAQLFWNAQDHGGGFQPVAAKQAGPDLFAPMVGRGSAFADVDGDGDLDVVITQNGGPARLLRNDQALGHRWLRLKLAGTKSNRDAIGANVKVQINGRTHWRRVMPSRGYLSQSEAILTIGLGASDKVDSLEIHWPNGGVQKVQAPAVNQLVVVQEQTAP